MLPSWHYIAMDTFKEYTGYSAERENTALDQAKAELPGAPLSEVLQRAAVIAAERRHLQK
jgi:hypothetical protein